MSATAPARATRARTGTAPFAAGTTTGEILRHWQEAVPHDRLAHLVRDAARAFQRALQIRLAAHDVTFSQWTFLRVLWQEDGLTQKALSVRAGVMEPTTFVAVAGLERRGLVVRRHRAGNRKNLHVHLTPAGRRLRRTLVPLAEAVNAVAVAGLPPAHVEGMRTLLLAILANLADDEARRVAAPAKARPRRLA